MDDRDRIAVLRAGHRRAAGEGPAVQYHLGDHLGSSQVVVGGDRLTDRAQISREEYYPYGETSFGGFARKRYRFIGKERDEESGLVNFGARPYSPWLSRWISPDPGGPRDGPNLYAFARLSPLVYRDAEGLQSDTPDKPGTALVPVAAAEPPAPTGKKDPPSPEPVRSPELGGLEEQLRTGLTRAEAELAQAMATLDNLRAQLPALAERIGALEAEIQLAEDWGDGATPELQEQLAQARAERRQLLREIREARSNVRRLTTQAARARQSVAALERARQAPPARQGLRGLLGRLMGGVVVVGGLLGVYAGYQMATAPDADPVDATLGKTMMGIGGVEIASAGGGAAGTLLGVPSVVGAAGAVGTGAGVAGSMVGAFVAEREYAEVVQESVAAAPTPEEAEKRQSTALNFTGMMWFRARR